MLPVFSGRPIRVEVRKSLGEHHAASSIPGRLILLDSGVLDRPGEFDRILIHELFHFVWVRLSNVRRRDWESLLAREVKNGDPGELGWSAESRKNRLTRRDLKERTRNWRQYCCESFCDSAAWLYADLRQHAEFTLKARMRHARRSWFLRSFGKEGPLLL